METVALAFAFFINNLIWMIFFQSQKEGKDFIQGIKEVIPKIKLPKKRQEQVDIREMTREDAQKALLNQLKSYGKTSKR